MAAALRCGLTAADFKNFSIGTVIDICAARVNLDKGDENGDEEKYIMMRSNLTAIQKSYESGKITEERYAEFMTKFKALEERYEF